jgi:hypothetical protein
MSDRIRYSNRPLPITNHGISNMVFVEGFGVMPVIQPPQPQLGYKKPMRGEVRGKKFIACMLCNTQYNIKTCFVGSSKHCGLFEGSEHTHIVCSCHVEVNGQVMPNKEVIFRGAVRFLTFENHPSSYQNQNQNQNQQPTEKEEATKEEEE